MRNEKKISKYGISKEEMSKGRPTQIYTLLCTLKKVTESDNEKRKKETMKKGR